MKPAIVKWSVVSTILQVAMVVLGHFVPSVASMFAIGGTGIGFLAGALYGAAGARSIGDSAIGGLIVGGVGALIGVAVSYLLGDVGPEIFLIGTGSSAVTGLIGGIVLFAIAGKKR